MIINPYTILNLSPNASIDDVKKAFKNIALKSHPDKLNDIKDPIEKNKRIKEFMDASNAYNKILNSNSSNDYDFCDFNDDDINYNDWQETFNQFKESDLFKELMNTFKKLTSKIIKHNVNADIKYSDYFNNNKKKLRLFLKKIEEPVYINLDCSKYPTHTINYFDNNDNEHEITINMTLINDPEINNGFYHIDNETKDIDIHYDLDINLYDYLIGSTKLLPYFNNQVLSITIQPFSNDYQISNLGINKGFLIINFKIIPINQEKWNSLNDADKNDLARILFLLKMI